MPSISPHRSTSAMYGRLLRHIVFATLFAVLSGTAAAAKVIRIAIDAAAFAPIDVTATVGDTIEWTNSDIVDHTATARNGDWDVEIPVGATRQLLLDHAGSLEYFCRFHPNMKGRIVVEPR